MKEFKLLRGYKCVRRQPGLVKLKDVTNRTKNLLCIWSEYPIDGDDSQIRTYQGNILQFYNMIKQMGISPTIYEIQKQYRGQQSSSLVYGNRNRHNEFISRKFYLTIKYTVL